mgnify:CR=1 FL=1
MRERMLDLLAGELGMDPVELRRRIRELPVRQEIPQARRGHDLGRFVAALAILGPP